MEILPVVLLAVCGVALVLGFLALLVFGVLRQHAPKLIEILGGAGAMFGDIEPNPQVQAQQNYRRRRPNLREKAQSLDFDSALAHTQLDNQAAKPPRAAPPWPSSSTPAVISRDPSPKPPPLDPPLKPPFEPDLDTSRVSSLRRKRRDRNQDEIFANKLDEDGDEWMDF